MSRWGRPIKNRKRIDPRYFLNEEQQLDEAHAAAHEGTCEETHPSASHDEWEASEAEKK